MTKFLAEQEVFYHGTYSNFKRFRPLSHFGTKMAAMKVVRNGMKKTEIMNGTFSAVPVSNGTPANIIPVHLHLHNTYELQDVQANHDRSFYRGMLLFHFLKDLHTKKLASVYDYVAEEPFKMSWNDVKKELGKDTLYELSNESPMAISELIDKHHLFMQRMIHYFESLGYDGFHYTNYYEDQGHISYVPFRPESVIRLDSDSVVLSQPYNLRSGEKIQLPGERDLNLDEFCTMKFEKLYRLENTTEKRFLLSNNRKVLLRPSSFRQMLHEKAYYSKILLSDILPKIELITNQSRYGYHGLTHTEQVGMFGIELALSVHQDPLPVMLAAGLHDCARTNDEYCEQHGPRCEPIARKFLADNYPDMLPIEVESIVTAVRDHTIGRNASDLVSACLWDADRIRLSWEMGYAPEFFSTPYGKMLASLSKEKQDRYIGWQERFLIDNKIKTRAQIEYDKAMNAKQNALGTVFNIRKK